jgi:hypothetical protein
MSPVAVGIFATGNRNFMFRVVPSPRTLQN